MPSEADKIIITVLLALYSAIFTCKAIKSQSAACMILSAVFSNLNLFFITNLWNTGNANTLVSCFGLLLSAVLIGIGFRAKQKTIRVAGLFTMIAYVFKIALFDVAQTGDMSRRIFVLLLGGVVCFGVSFAYNKLDKLYGNVENTDIKDEKIT
ncbi:MAG: DUF2339 domain-containing protein [Oscillospiraceae bacterium]|nr:DUF2339 domain-containing protein [Oscillospiraceae bacterium]